MRRILITALVAAFAMAMPAAASADEPIECKVLNAAGQKLTGDDLVMCFDDPNPRDDAVEYVLSLIELRP